MERLDPQGEENGDHHMAASYQYLNRLAGADPSLFQNNPLLRMQLQHHYQQQMMRPSLFLGSNSSTPISGSRMATPTAGPMMMGPKGMMMDSPGVFPNAIMPRSLHDDIWPQSRMRPSSPMVTNAGGTMLPMSMSSNAASNSSVVDSQASLSKLNPSVYSHPNAHDPVLMMPKSSSHMLHSNHRDLAVLGGRRANVDMTSSGAFFDPRAVSKLGKDSSQMEILAQLTREMRLQQQAGSGLFSYSSDAVSSSSGGSGNHLNQIPTTSGGQASSNSTSPAKNVAATTSSSGYNSGNSSGQIIENRRQSLKANSTSSLLTSETTSTSSNNTIAKGPGKNNNVEEKKNQFLSETSLSQPDLFTSIDSPQSDVATVVTYSVNNSNGLSNSAAAANSIFETLKNDNRDMKSEILDLRKKVSKVSMLEEEMSKVHQAYQSLLKHSEKREQLEKAARAKLQSVILNLSEANKVKSNIYLIHF